MSDLNNQTPNTEVAVEQVAQWLHDEGGFDEAWQATWPEHPDDTGQRDGGYVRIVSSDVQAKFRDVARRLLATGKLPFATRPSAPDRREVEARLKKEVIRLNEEANMDDRASTSSQNPDARPVFSLWAEVKRQRAADIEFMLAALASLPPSPASEDEATCKENLQVQDAHDEAVVEDVDRRLNGLVGLLRREARHSGVWFAHKLVEAADAIAELRGEAFHSQAERAKVIEECARVADEAEGDSPFDGHVECEECHGFDLACSTISTAIRALAEPQDSFPTSRPSV